MFDGLIGDKLWHQIESRDYSVTTGRITCSEVARRRGSKGGTIYTPDIHYHYVVNGQSFDEAQLRYNAGPTGSDEEWATQIVNEHPIGSETQVFFNPNNPADSVLSPGLDGSDVMAVLFLMPFNVVGLVFGMAAAGRLREWLFRPIAGGVKIIADGIQTRIRLPRVSAVISGAIGLGGVSFVSIFIVLLLGDGHPSFGFASTFLLLAIAGGIGAYVWQWRKIHSGDDDLIVNETSGVVELPITHGRKQRITVNVSDIAGISVQTIEHRSSKGGVSYTYAPTLHSCGAGKQKLADWGDQIKADAFSEWLQKKLGLKALDLEDQRFS